MYGRPSIYITRYQEHFTLEPSLAAFTSYVVLIVPIECKATVQGAGYSDFAVLMPARNEEATVGKVVQEVRACLGCAVIVVDDASTDATAGAARAAGATVLPLALQLGAWGATQAGIRYALSKNYRTVVTMDADGQHQAVHIAGLLDPITAGEADVVIGACPERASHARRMAWTYFRLLTGLRLEDITSGFRAYNRVAMQVLASREASLLDYQDIGVLLILQHKNLRTLEVPVAMRARTSGGSRVFSSWWVVGKYMLRTSLLCIARVGMNGVSFRSRQQRRN